MSYGFLRLDDPVETPAIEREAPVGVSEFIARECRPGTFFPDEVGLLVRLKFSKSRQIASSVGVMLEPVDAHGRHHADDGIVCPRVCELLSGTAGDPPAHGESNGRSRNRA